MEVTAKDRENWDEHWQQRDREFETFLNADSDLKFFSNIYLYVWDGNHRLLVWNDHIDKVHTEDLAWHYQVILILLKTMDSVTGVHAQHKQGNQKLSREEQPYSYLAPNVDYW